MNTYWKDRLFVATQFVLMLSYVMPINLGYFRHFPVIGWVLTLIGCLIGAWAIWQLRHALSPYPTPKSSASLIDEGIFQWIRHPIYTGVLTVALGYTFYSGSVWRGVITLCLLILFQFKARYEERLLQARFDEYLDYMNKTGRFLPKVGK